MNWKSRFHLHLHGPSGMRAARACRQILLLELVGASAQASLDTQSLCLVQRNAVAHSTDDLPSSSTLVAERNAHEEYQSLQFRVKSGGAFVDVTPNAFPESWYRWNHSGFPRSHQGTPTFVDFNSDGLLDYFYHNHYEPDPTENWDMGIAGPSILTGHGPFYESVGHRSFQLTEPAQSKWNTIEPSMDSHGTAILDIDRDGHLDIYIATGGGQGLVGGPCKNAVIMWGTGKGNFFGGRSAAEKANIHNKDSRGRMNYWADINGDGLLDVIFLNEPRADTIHAPGYAMMNKGNRKFTALEDLVEYAETIILHDADGDGHAEEFVVPRRDCAIKTCGYRGDNTCKQMVADAPAWYEFCKTHPEGSLAIYKFDHSEGKLKMVSSPTRNNTIGASMYHVVSMQSGDFDGDGLADLAMLYPAEIAFYYSSKREKGQLAGAGAPSEKVQWSTDSCEGAALRAADLDNDGNLELLVLCFVVGESGPRHKLFSRWGSPTQWKLEDSSWLGAFVDKSLVRPSGEQLSNLCNTVSSESFLGYRGKMCKEYKGESEPGHLARPRAMGLSVVDFNNDGLLDVSISYDLGRLLMLQNNFQTADHKFLTVKLVGKKSNEYGVGATVILHTSGMQKNVHLREVYSVSHETDWLGTHDDRIIFGLGRLGVPEYIEVRWPGKSHKVQFISSPDILTKHLNSMTSPLMIVESD